MKHVLTGFIILMRWSTKSDLRFKNEISRHMLLKKIVGNVGYMIKFERSLDL